MSTRYELEQSEIEAIKTALVEYLVEKWVIFEKETVMIDLTDGECWLEFIEQYVCDTDYSRELEEALMNPVCELGPFGMLGLVNYINQSQMDLYNEREAIRIWKMDELFVMVGIVFSREIDFEEFIDMVNTREL